MTVIEVVGFLILVLAFMAPVLRRMLEERARKKDPEGYRRMKEAEAKRMRKELGIFYPSDEELEEEEDMTPVPPPPKQAVLPVSEEPYTGLATHKFRPTITSALSIQAGRGLDSELEHHEVVRRQTRPSRMALLLESLPSKQSLALIHEVFAPPLALRDPASFSYLHPED